jgi:mono/diheme cytochrome c family protein
VSSPAIRSFPGAILWMVVLAVRLGDAQAPGPGSATLAAPATAVTSGEEIYRTACVTCHGSDGRGSPRTIVGFETELPDFTDCAFATAEADIDWQAVVHNGGPIRGLSRSMPAFGDALTADEIDGVLGYVRQFCADDRWPRGNLNFPRALFTEKAFPENEVVYTNTVTRGDEAAVGNEIVYERRFGARNQIEAVVPFDSVKQPEEWNFGLGERWSRATVRERSEPLVGRSPSLQAMQPADLGMVITSSDCLRCSARRCRATDSCKCMADSRFLRTATPDRRKRTCGPPLGRR